MLKKKTLLWIIPSLVFGLWLQTPTLTHAQESTGVNEERLRERQDEERRRAEEAGREPMDEAPADEKAQTPQTPGNEADAEAELSGGCSLQSTVPASMLQGLALLTGLTLPLVNRRKKSR